MLEPRYGSGGRRRNGGCLDSLAAVCANAQARFVMKLWALALLLVVAAVSLAACGSNTGGDDEATTAGSATATESEEAGARTATELRLVGQHELGGDGAADVWALGEVAYVGGRCDGGGVKIVDVSEPARPRLVASAAEHAATSAEDVMVIDARTPSSRAS